MAARQGDIPARSGANACGNAMICLGKGQIGDPHLDPDALAGQDFMDLRGDIGILSRKECRGCFKHGHLGSEAAKDLREFKADIAAAQNDKMIGHDVQVHNVGIGQIRNSLDPRHRRHRGPGTYVDKNPRGLQLPVVDRHRMWPGEPRVPADHGNASSVIHPAGDVGPRGLNDCIFSRAHPGCVHRYRARHDAEPFTLACQPRRMGRRDECLGRRATGIDAGAAHLVAFDQRHPFAGRSQPGRHRRASLTCPDHNAVECLTHGMAFRSVPRLQLPVRNQPRSR